MPGKNRKRIEKLQNQIKVWWSIAKFQNQEEADRLFRKFQSGPDKFLRPFMAGDYSEDASANWERIKENYGLTTQGNRDKELRDYEEQAERYYKRKKDTQETQTMIDSRSDSTDPVYYLGQMEIHEALRNEWAGKEKNPPHGSGYNDWLTPMNLPLSDKLRQVIEHIRDEYEYNTQQATRRLLRYGTQELVRVLQEEIIQDDASLEEYRTAGKRAARFVHGASHGYSTLDEKVEVDTNFGTRTSGKNSYKIVWNQKESIGWIATQIGISEADAFRWALTVAGEALAENDRLPEALGKDIADIDAELHQFSIRRRDSIMNSSIIAILEAFEQGYGPEVGESCKEDMPNMWTEFATTITHTFNEIRKIGSEETVEDSDVALKSEETVEDSDVDLNPEVLKAEDEVERLRDCSQPSPPPGPPLGPPLTGKK